MFMVVKHFEFEGAHFLPGYKGKCKEMHGHTWKLKVGVGFPHGQAFDINDDGMILDFSILKSIVQKTIVEELDHKIINEVVQFHPTCENLVLKYIRPRLIESLEDQEFSLLMIKLWETSGSYVEWRSS
jgi:6-pyruvoyltetrahydropterin/6-carboxytetrahydropterin synthase